MVHIEYEAGTSASIGKLKAAFTPMYIYMMCDVGRYEDMYLTLSEVRKLTARRAIDSFLERVKEEMIAALPEEFR
jgi:hypothetical protein